MASVSVSLVAYDNPSLVPAWLRPVGFVTGDATADVRQITALWVDRPESARVGDVCWGAVKYASRDLVPPSLTYVVTDTEQLRTTRIVFSAGLAVAGALT